MSSFWARRARVLALRSEERIASGKDAPEGTELKECYPWLNSPEDSKEALKFIYSLGDSTIESLSAPPGSFDSRMLVCPADVYKGQRSRGCEEVNEIRTLIKPSLCLPPPRTKAVSPTW